MNYYKALLQHAYPVDIQPSETSYFSEISKGLDPTLFRGDKLIPNVRNGILSLVHSGLSKRFQGSESWLHAWLAGSGVSHQWAAHRDPADLDCLVGIDYNKFRQTNPNYAGFSNKDIADEINAFFTEELHPQTDNYLGHFDLTFYANVKSDITQIKPYAAYSLTDDKWVVEPKKEAIQRRPEWDAVVHQDIQKAYNITDRYKKSLEDLKSAPHDAARRNAETALLHATQQGAALFDEIHLGRGEAFSPTGHGYEDFANYRWQAGKEAGIIQSLKKLKVASKTIRGNSTSDTYGIELPDTSTLIRRAALQNRSRM